MDNRFSGPDPDNKGWLKGWAVRRMTPWQFVGLFLDEAEANQAQKDHGDGYEVVYGSLEIGTDNFIS